MMAEPEISWPHAPHADPEPLPPIRWVRWLIACLILLTLALLGHTSGRYARTTMVETRHWITTTTRIPALAQVSALGHFLPSKAPLAPHSTGWLAPVGQARIGQAFGWHGSGASAQFSSGVRLDVARYAPVMAGVKATLHGVGRDAVTLSTGQGYQIRIVGLRLASLHQGHTVQPTTVLGRTDQTHLTISVTREGYPVNPLGPSLYGSGWLRH